MSKAFDVGIIGAGVAGCIATYKLCFHPDNKVILFDIGRSFAKRRRQLEGALGCFPNGDGKLYTGDLDQVNKLIDGRKTRHAQKWITELFSEAGPMRETRDNNPAAPLLKRLTENNYNINLNNYIQWKPDPIHILSKIIADKIESVNHIRLEFDNQVYKIYKKRDIFHIVTQTGEFLCKKIIFCPGRSGWRWANSIFKELGISTTDDYARFGMTVEISGQYVRELNKSHCTLTKDNVIIGPFNWNGTIVPEDHADVVVSSFRSNEDRWRSEKVSFSIIGNIEQKEQGVYQTDRLAKLAFLLSNDRVGKEKLREFMKDKHDLCLIPEYQWLKGAVEDLYKILPNLQIRGSYHVPTINPLPGNINIDKNLETELEGLFVAGEVTGISGIMAAALMGACVVESALK